MSSVGKTTAFEQLRKHQFKATKFSILLIVGWYLLLVLWTKFGSLEKPSCYDDRSKSWWSLFPAAIPSCKEFSFIEDTVRRVKGNESCTVIGCHSPGTAGSESFWSYYSQLGYSTAVTSFTELQRGGKTVHPTWCRILSAQRELRRNPRTRVLYVDIDTRVDVNVWCNMPHLGKKAPIIMTSLHRKGLIKAGKYTVHGTQVQANAFVVTPGREGLRAMLRWQNTYTNIAFRDQGVIHLREQGVCGVPGWIHCFGNPEQQTKHCTGFKKFEDKEACIANLFK